MCVMSWHNMNIWNRTSIQSMCAAHNINDNVRTTFPFWSSEQSTGNNTGTFFMSSVHNCSSVIKCNEDIQLLLM